MTLIDIQVTDLCLQEFKRVLSFQDGTQTEYQGRAIVEDEQVLGNSDKMIFYAKEMLADLTCKPKHLIDPFLIAKLDIETIKKFEFPQIPIALNKYTMQKKGIAGAQYMM